MVVELSLRLKHECPFLEFSTQFGKKPVYHYCSTMNDYLIIPEKLSEDKKVFAQIIFGRFENLTIKEIGKPSEMTYISMDCPCGDTLQTNIAPKMRELKAVPIYPITYQNGYEYYKVYCKSESRADNFISSMDEIVEIEILSREDLGDDWIISQTAVLKQLIEELTPLQTNTLIQAFEGGYYNIPRNIKTEDIAKRNGKTRYAVDKTLRSAENKILNYIMPFVYLQQSNVHVKPCIYDKFPLKVEI